MHKLWSIVEIRKPGKRLAVIQLEIGSFYKYGVRNRIVIYYFKQYIQEDEQVKKLHYVKTNGYDMLLTHDEENGTVRCTNRVDTTPYLDHMEMIEDDSS